MSTNQTNLCLTFTFTVGEGEKRWEDEGKEVGVDPKEREEKVKQNP